MPATTMKALWESYRIVLPANASPTQIIETRRAFYAGAGALLAAILASLTPGPEPQEADLAMMDSVHAELTQFAKDISEGKA